MLELAVLGLLHDAPMHGYELRKRLQAMLGPFGAYSCGSLYPTLRRLLRSGSLAEDPDASGETDRPRRNRRVYRLTSQGRDRFADLVAECDRQACDDGTFLVRLAFFSRTPAECRVRVLQARRRKVEQRREDLRTALAEQRFDDYTFALHRFGLDTCEREVQWLSELIERERTERTGHDR